MSDYAEAARREYAHLEREAEERKMIERLVAAVVAELGADDDAEEKISRAIRDVIWEF